MDGFRRSMVSSVTIVRKTSIKGVGFFSVDQRFSRSNTILHKPATASLNYILIQISSQTELYPIKAFKTIQQLQNALLIHRCFCPPHLLHWRRPRFQHGDLCSRCCAPRGLGAARVWLQVQVRGRMQKGLHCLWWYCRQPGRAGYVYLVLWRHVRL